jgi:hypothetical protein
MNEKRLGEIAIFSVVVLLIQIVLSKWIYPLFGTSTQALFSISPYSAVGSQTIGNKILGLITGIIPLNLGSITVWITMFIGAFVLLLAGYWAYDQKIAWKGRNMTERIFALLLYGSIALYAALFILGALNLFSTPLANLAIPMAIGVGINYLVIAIIISALAKQKAFNFLRI